MNKLKSIVFGVSALALSVVGYQVVAGDSLQATTRQCDSNAIVYCGALTESELSQKYQKNATGDLDNIYSSYGVSSAAITGQTGQAGYVTKTGNVYIGSKLVATNANSLGRLANYGGSAVKIGGKTYYRGSTQERFAASRLDAFVFTDANGRFVAAILLACGNPIGGKPVEPPKPPVYKCDSLTASATKITAGQNVTFTTRATAQNGAVLKAYSYDFGDGSKAAAGATTSHVYAKPGTYTAKVTVTVTVDGKVVTAPGSCAVTVVVSPIPCPVPGKENLPKDSPLCVEDKPSVSITKTVNNVEHAKVMVGETFEYEIVVKNTGNVALKNAVVTDKAPTEVTLLSASAGTVSGNTWTYTIPELKVGESKSFTIKAKYAKYATGTHKNTVCVDTPTVPGSPDDCDDATTETHENITVCDLTDNSIKTIDRSEFDESHMTTDQTKCGNMHVCVIADKTEKDIAKKDFDAATMTTDVTKCVDTPVTPVVELPHTGVANGIASIVGAGSLVGVGAAYVASRRNLR